VSCTELGLPGWGEANHGQFGCCNLTLTGTVRLPFFFAVFQAHISEMVNLL
jgi:hypothetical protein